jgi:hypothetical protein
MEFKKKKKYFFLFIHKNLLEINKLSNKNF